MSRASGQPSRSAAAPDAVAALTAGRRRLYGVLAAALAIAGVLVLAEIVCRVLPTNDGLRAQPVNAQSPVFRFAPDRSATVSKGWSFAIVNEVRTNNEGFVNDRDYEPGRRDPLLAVVGDSYIEAAIVPFGETLHGRLAAAVEGRGRVYSFAASGAGLAQYLVWAAYARDRFQPDGMAVLIIANDFSEALWHLERSPGFHHFARRPDGGAELRRVDYAPSPVRRLLRESALAMYLVTNLTVQRLLDLDVRRLGADDARWVANIAAEVSDERFAEYRWAWDRFLERLPAAAGLPPGRIALLFDGIRPQLYEPGGLAAVAGSAWARLRAYGTATAAARGFAVVDLQPRFLAHYATHGRRFEFATDTHWNGVGHGVAAAALAETEVFSALFGSVPAARPR